MVSRKRVRCASCNRRLGTYDVYFHDTGVAELISRRVPLAMLDFPGGKVGFRLQSNPEGDPNRFRWRCGCGANPVLRNDTVFKRWSRRDSTEVV